jgi:PIN domain nuclease of toxin-antitoxin system
MAMLRGEPSRQRVRALILEEEPAMSSVNLGEVLYALIRTHGPGVAAERTDGIRQVVEVLDPDWPLVQAAARVKAGGGLSYADAFCVALSERHQAPVATGDPEILGLNGLAEMIDLREES